MLHAKFLPFGTFHAIILLAAIGYVTSKQQIASTDDPSVLTCPSNCSSWTSPFKVFGDVIYSNNSDRCWAAIHAGAISCDNGGRFLFTAVDGVTSYESVERNGVVSETQTGNDGQHGGAFLTRPFAVDAASVKTAVKGKKVTITDWTSIPGDN